MDYGRDPKTRIECFEKIHGPDFACGEAFIYYQDGARREHNPLGAFNEPPEDPRKLYHNICHFYQLKLDQAVSQFDELKDHLAKYPGLDPNGDENIKKLRRLRHKAKGLQAKLEFHQEELRKHSPGYQSPEEVESEREMQMADDAAKAKYTEAVNAITI